MIAYVRIYRALTTGRPVPASEAAQLLAQLRQDHGQEFADDLTTWAAKEYGEQSNESQADARRRRRSFGAVRKATARLLATAKAPRP
ncbi:hypothetical protein ABZ690_00840 [Streptomyces sp. NPDC006967]|uniref:hypothetical protein n=1 Tax=Streptomyces sp. NPDC006967 TaxID=3156906 RepID=UPI0033E80DC0